MAERKRMTDAARKFIETGQIESSPAIAPTTANTEELPSTGGSLRSELLGEEKVTEPNTRFTVDLPRSLHRRLDQLSIDSGKPKTELVRIMIRRALDDIAY